MIDLTRAVEEASRYFDSLTDQQRVEWQEKNDAEHRAQHIFFRQGYRLGKCYLCGKDFETVSRDSPCLHWLLRRGKFKPKDIKLVAERWGYHQISAYLRWCANEEKLISNINDIKEEAPLGKFISATIRWKNIEWTFDCSANDLAGHGGVHSNFPHYHFQMRIDGRQFINFNDYHLPFSNEDLFFFKLDGSAGIKMDFGVHGAGMQDAVSFDPEDIVNFTSVTSSEEDSAFHMSTSMISLGEPMRGEDIYELIQESRKSGRSFAALAREKYQGGDVAINTVISPSDGVPVITPRTERERR